MPLLTLLTRQALDDDYAHVARRRAARRPDVTEGDDPAGEQGSSGRVVSTGLLLTGMVILLFGVMMATAFVQRVRDAPQRDSSRAALISQVVTRKTELAGRQSTLGSLRATTAALSARDDVLTDDQRTVEQRARDLAAIAGFGPVTGPGLRITVNDSESGLDTERVVDSDLATLVDALWGVGAEAIAINGQRLTGFSAIRNSGIAIHVNEVPLRPPYVVEAIGDPLTMSADLSESPRGVDFQTIVDYLHFRVDRQNVEELRLPGAPIEGLGHATYGAGAGESSVVEESS